MVIGLEVGEPFRTRDHWVIRWTLAVRVRNGHEKEGKYSII